MAIVPRVDVPVPSVLVFDWGPTPPDDVMFSASPGPSSAGMLDSAAVLGPSSTPPAVSRRSDSTGVDWRTVASIGYAAGLMLFLVRLAAGWRMARHLVRGASPVSLANRWPVLESSVVTTPLTTGVLSPVVVLPDDWRDWPEEKRRAVLTHENAHIARRDHVVALLARLNRAIFWFHPIAWWLERILAVAAEHACDEIAARELGEPRRYAQVLVDMADAVRRRGRRVAWHALGVDGSGHLGARIDRLLRRDALLRMSVGRQVAITAACGAVLILAIACRQRAVAAPLQPDPEVAAQLQAQADRTERFRAIVQQMTPEEADALESRLAKAPDDWDAREQLVTYYSAGRNVPWDRKVPGIRRHALWLIEHHPEHRIQPPSISPQHDPEGWIEALRLWDAHLSRPDVSPFLVYRAAQFVVRYDKPRAEALILRGRDMDPESEALTRMMPPNVTGYQWDYQLASLYGAALLGSGNPVGFEYNPERANSPFAQAVRKKLDASDDPVLLARVGEHLLRTGSAQTQAADVHAEGRRYVERALTLKPDLASARRTLRMADDRERGQRIATAIREGTPIPEADRLVHLAAKAAAAYMRVDQGAYYLRKDNKPVPSFDKEIAEAKAFAEEALRLAAASPQHPDYTAVVMSAHQTLGLIALRAGERAAAVRHLLESVKVPPMDETTPDPPHWLRLTNYLLREGERESVITFLDELAQVSPTHRERALADATAARAPRMPRS
jgi:tetratricopeptide (TPR) repeat protein